MYISSLRHQIRIWIQALLLLVSIIVIGAIVVDYGFVLDEREMSFILHIYRYTWWIYVIAYLLQLIFNMLWTFFFFNLMWYLFSFFCIIVLIILVLIMIYKFIRYIIQFNKIINTFIHTN